MANNFTPIYCASQENELYYLGRSLRSNYPEEPSYSLRKESDQETIAAKVDDIYDRISQNSDIMDDNEILVNQWHHHDYFNNYIISWWYTHF